MQRSDREECRAAAGEIVSPDRLERDDAGSTPSRDKQGWSAMHMDQEALVPSTRDGFTCLTTTDQVAMPDSTARLALPWMMQKRLNHRAMAMGRRDVGQAGTVCCRWRLNQRSLVARASNIQLRMAVGIMIEHPMIGPTTAPASG